MIRLKDGKWIENLAEVFLQVQKLRKSNGKLGSWIIFARVISFEINS